MKPYYDDGTCVIYHGSALSVLADVSGIATTVTSPPYNTLGSRVPSKPTGGFGSERLGGWVRNLHATGYADDMDEGRICLMAGVDCCGGGGVFRSRSVVLLQP